jgi:hypothetical protein
MVGLGGSMSTRRWFIACALLSAVAGCFSVSPADGALKCDPTATRSCPQGYYCSADTSSCFRTGHSPDAGVVVGRTCASPADCGGGACVDGFCCDSACDGVCEACNLPGSQGTCSAIAADTDPEKECPAKLVVGNADGGLNTPPGGVFTSAAACAGACSGQRSCTFPGPQTSCGQTFCNDTITVASFVCNGGGDCEPKLNACADYRCGNAACLSQCPNGDSDCQPGDYCANNACVPKVVNGQACTAPNQCKSGNCVNNTGGTAKLCCNSQCDPSNNMQCDITPGVCTCGGLTCGMGCQLFYVDADGDGHGDETGTLANSRAIAGCVGMTSIASGGKNYFPDDQPNKMHLDCDDMDANVYRGQTTYFTMPRLHPNPLPYDFDCDGVESKGLQEYNHGCLACTYYNGPQCIDNGGVCSTNPAVNSNISGFNCGFACPNGAGGYNCCGFGPDGFTGPVGCGVTGGSVAKPWTHCTDCPGGTAPGATTDPTKKQACR